MASLSFKGQNESSRYGDIFETLKRYIKPAVMYMWVSEVGMEAQRSDQVIASWITLLLFELFYFFIRSKAIWRCRCGFKNL